MLRCIAIDDEELALELLEDNISKVDYLQLVGTFNNPLKAIQVLQEQAIDLVFLDIQMPGLSGLQLIQAIPNKPMFILVIAYEKFALEGYDLNVVDYLVKPVPLERFIKACNKAWELYNLKTQPKPVQDQNAPDYFFVNVDYSLLKITRSDIVYIEGLKDYVKIHLKSTTKPIVPRITMKGLEEQLPHSEFIRIHKSYIVSIKSIIAVRKNSLFIGTLELPVSDNYRDDINKLVNQS
jgi:DNA-binding LytR/AlgR family response regulator